MEDGFGPGGSAPRDNSYRYTPLEQEMHIAPFFYIYKRRKVFKDFKENRSVHVQNEENVKNNENTNDDDLLYSMDYGFVNGHLVEDDAVEKCFEDLSLNDSDITTDGPESASDFELVLDERERFGSKRLTHTFQLSDEEILGMLPRSVDGIGDAQALAKCRDDSCQRIASSGCQGYCTEHFCELYRRGKVEIKANKIEYTPRERITSRYEARSAGDQRRIQLDLRQERPKRSQRASTHRDRKQVPVHYKRTSKVCAAPLCTTNVHDSEMCDRCSLKFQRARPMKKERTTREDITSKPIKMEMTAPAYTSSRPVKTHRMEPEIAPSKPAKKKPQDKWRCVNPLCDLPTNTKHGLCTKCSTTLMDANAEKVGMPRAEVLPVGRERHRRNTESRRMQDHETYRYHPREQLGAYDDEYLQVERHYHRSRDVQKYHRHGLNQDPAYNGERYRDQHGAPYRTEVESPPLMRDVTNSSTSEDDSSLASFVSKAKPMQCKSTGCGNFGNKACRGYCNSCFARFS